MISNYILTSNVLINFVKGTLDTNNLDIEKMLKDLIISEDIIPSTVLNKNEYSSVSIFNQFLKEISIETQVLPVYKTESQLNPFKPIQRVYTNHLYESGKFSITVFETYNFQFYHTILKYLDQTGLLTQDNTKLQKVVDNKYKYQSVDINLVYYNDNQNQEQKEDTKTIATFYNVFPYSVEITLPQTQQSTEPITTKINFISDVYIINPF